MSNIITVQPNQTGELVVDSRLVAEQLGVKHKNLLETIKKHQSSLEQAFGQFTFETETVQNSVGAVNEVRYAYLTEPQAIALMTFSRNTERVVECKIGLVKAFESAKQKIKDFQPELIPSPTPIRPTRDAVLELVNAASTLGAAQVGPHLKKLLEDALIEEVSLIKPSVGAIAGSATGAIASAKKPEYTIAKVRARELGYSLTDIGTGSGLGSFIAKRINAEFSERVGKYPVKHYRVTPKFDDAIHEYFRRPRLIEG